MRATFRLILVLLAVASPGAAQQHRLVDDQGNPVLVEIEICWYQGLKRSCEEISGDAEPMFPETFDFAVLEGPQHGPVTVRPGGHPSDDPIVIPRKSTIVMTGLPDGRATASLYRVDDQDFRKPWKRWSLSRMTHEVRVPSGPSLLSISTPSAAPDLHLLDLLPGSESKIAYTRRSGWSLVVKAVEPAEGLTLRDVRVVVEATPGYSVDGDSQRIGATGTSGLAVFSGLNTPLARVLLSVAGRIPDTLPAVAASPGTFAYEVAHLGVGGRLTARVSLDGEALEGAECHLRHPFQPVRPGQTDPNPPALVTFADAEGVCRGERISPDRYLLEVSPPSESGRISRVVDIEEGVHLEEDMFLQAYRLRGSVMRGEEPAAGLTVDVRSIPERGLPGSPRPAASAPVDEEGVFEAIVWQEGHYGAILRTETGTPVDIRRVYLNEAVTHLDFQLTATDLEGIVVDEGGESVPEAYVTLTWIESGRRAHQNAVTNPAGQFRFPLKDTQGTARVKASKEGYEDSETISISPTDGTAVTLLLSEQPSLHGRLTTAQGRPVIGAWVGSYRDSPIGPQGLAQTTTDFRGEFEIAYGPTRPASLWLTGPGCPLHEKAVSQHDGGALVVLTCPSLPGTLDLILRREDTSPLPGAGVHLRKNRRLIPPEALRAHQERTVGRWVTDANGRLPVVGLEPGEYDVFLATKTSPARIGAGQPDGILSTIQLRPLEVRELAATTD